MANPTAAVPFDHNALKASLRAAKLREQEVLVDLDPGLAYTIRPTHAQDDVLRAIGSYRQRYSHTPQWFEWRYPQMLVLGPHR